MKRFSISFPEHLYIFAFFLYLIGSSLTLIEHGAELSLWVMTFAVFITMVTTLFPWLGIRWLRLERKGSQAGWWWATGIRVASWGVFGYAMTQRLIRNFPLFYQMITLTTLLWAGWLLILIYSRHASRSDTTGDTLRK